MLLPDRQTDPWNLELSRRVGGRRVKAGERKKKKRRRKSPKAALRRNQKVFVSHTQPTCDTTKRS